MRVIAFEVFMQHEVKKSETFSMHQKRAGVFIQCFFFLTATVQTNCPEDIHLATLSKVIEKLL